MGAYIGTLGSLFEVTQHAQEQSSSMGIEPTFFTGIDGSRAAFVPPTPGAALRSWSIGMSDAYPEQAAVFQSLCLGAYAPPPYVYLDPLSQVTNLLTPRQSILEQGTLRASDLVSKTPLPGVGITPSVRVTGQAWVQIGVGTPVLPGRPVTVAATMAGAGRVRVYAIGSSVTGAAIENASSPVTTVVAGDRVHATLVPSDGVASVALRVWVEESMDIALPSITWTSEPQPWSIGRGATAVVVHDYAESYEVAGTRQHHRAVSYTAKITEVGAGA